MKKVSLSILLILSFQLLFPLHSSFAKDPQIENVAPIELAAAPETSSDENVQIPKKDEEFGARSKKASKFTFKDLPKHLGYDIKDSFWGWGALGFAVGAGISGALYTKDKSIEYSFQPHAMFGSTADTVISDIGSPYAMLGAGVITTIVGAGTHNEKLTTTGESMLESLFWSELITIGAKYAFRRTRPDGGKNGFPSAHAAGAFSTASVLQMMFGWKVGLPAYAFASVVALARVDAYKHFPSDVLMGATIGTVIAYGTSKFHKQLHNNFAIVPEVGKDRYGLLLYHEF